MIVRLRNPFATYELRDPERVETDAGPCLRAEYRLVGDEAWSGVGDFRLDIAALETVSGQMNLKEAA